MFGAFVFSAASGKSQALDTSSNGAITGPSAAGADAWSSSLPDAPKPAMGREAAGGNGERESGEYITRPFSALGVEIKVGVGGIGFDVATPLTPKLNLRAGASFFTYSLNNLEEDGFNINGTISLKSVNTSVDWFPFLRSSFRVSPGVTLFNGNNFHGTANVPGGNTITLNDADYTSDPTDPLVATYSTQNNRFGNRIAPSITTGFGNLVPRDKTRHWSVPFEIGFQYIAPPKVLLNLSGSACDVDGCGNVQTDASTQANVQGQQKIINDDIHNLRFFPIVSIGVGYKF
jgi:hypothetical protein